MLTKCRKGFDCQEIKKFLNKFKPDNSGFNFKKHEDEDVNSYNKLLEERTLMKNNFKFKQKLMALCAFGVVSTFFLMLLRNSLQSTELNGTGQPENVKELMGELERLETILSKQRVELDELNKKLESKMSSHPRAKVHHRSRADNQQTQNSSSAARTELIPVLVLVCNRPEAVKEIVNKLLRYRMSKEQFPIVVSQDCDHRALQATVTEFGQEVQYVKHISSETARLKIPHEQRKFAVYYKISRHYKLALNHIFMKLNHSSVIVIEDDLDIAPDFFEYFQATRPLLEEDKSLFCVSAWNDNGKANLIDPNANSLLYRSDFFPGLGWMMTRDLWLEIGPKWPDGFWDDFIREPEQRRNRSCIRPEISRTAMTDFGKKGASKGLFFNRYLKKIVLNQNPVQFTKLDLHYLLRDNYQPAFLQRIYYSLPKTSIDGLMDNGSSTGSGQEFRIEYDSMDHFEVIAQQIGIMADTKAGVPRTAYFGVISCFFNGIRLFIAPADPAKWPGYDRHWEAPRAVLDGLQ